MRREDFELGKSFRCGGRLWRCTDVGTRVVVAIRLDEVCVSGSDGERTLDQHEAEAEGWFHGPPYAVAEAIFDEDDQEECEPIDAERPTVEPTSSAATNSSM